jgi:hypothetical protein
MSFRSVHWGSDARGLAGGWLVRRRPEARYSALVWIALAIYCVAGAALLAEYRRVWQRGGEEARLVAHRTVEAASGLPPGSEVDLVNVTRFLPPYIVSVCSNGLADALAGNGLPASIHVIRNFAQTSPEQQSLMTKLEACTQSSAEVSGTARIILVTEDHHLVQAQTACAAPLIDADRAEHPQAWNSLDSIPNSAGY